MPVKDGSWLLLSLDFFLTCSLPVTILLPLHGLALAWHVLLFLSLLCCLLCRALPFFPISCPLFSDTPPWCLQGPAEIASRKCSLALTIVGQPPNFHSDQIWSVDTDCRGLWLRRLERLGQLFRTTLWTRLLVEQDENGSFSSRMIRICLRFRLLGGSCVFPS